VYVIILFKWYYVALNYGKVGDSELEVMCMEAVVGTFKVILWRLRDGN
jgi:hypothetical protein